MARGLSASVLRELYSQSTDEAFLLLLTITHSTFTTLRLVNNTENITSNGKTFEAYPFAIVLPDDTPERAPRASLVFGNVTRELIGELRTLTGKERIKIRIDVIMASDPDTLLVTHDDFSLRNVNYDEQSIKGELTLEDFLGEQFPGDRFSPAHFPALF